MWLGKQPHVGGKAATIYVQQPGSAMAKLQMANRLRYACYARWPGTLLMYPLAVFSGTGLRDCAGTCIANNACCPAECTADFGANAECLPGGGACQCKQGELERSSSGGWQLHVLLGTAAGGWGGSKAASRCVALLFMLHRCCPPMPGKLKKPSLRLGYRLQRMQRHMHRKLCMLPCRLHRESRWQRRVPAVWWRLPMLAR